MRPSTVARCEAMSNPQQGGIDAHHDAGDMVHNDIAHPRTPEPSVGLAELPQNPGSNGSERTRCVPRRIQRTGSETEEGVSDVWPSLPAAPSGAPNHGKVT
ncbi:hypothetical protein GCM10010330_05330 [Streptomyces tendae]|nr:hypothetical protein GCM10010330_05330 [Streptomyces tendae]